MSFALLRQTDKICSHKTMKTLKHNAHTHYFSFALNTQTHNRDKIISHSGNFVQNEEARVIIIDRLNQSEFNRNLQHINSALLFIIRKQHVIRYQHKKRFITTAYIYCTYISVQCLRTYFRAWRLVFDEQRKLYFVDLNNCLFRLHSASDRWSQCALTV